MEQIINDLDTPKKPITHLSLCTGYEGIGEGLRNIFPNLREIAYLEREGYAIANLVAKMEEGELVAAPIYTDVKTFPYRRFLNKVSILSGGFPCQPFSQVTKDRKSTEDERHLFPYILKGIEECQPELVFLENVQGIISAKTADGEPVLKYVLRSLEEVGYKTTAGIFSAREINAPHLRKRVFILSHNKSFRCTGWQDKDHNNRWWFQELQSNQQSILWSEVERCSGDNGKYRFPEKPNKSQHPWEEPRVKPKLGRTTNGFDSRLDRLRLLGNGVVPATAERAFRVLSSRLI